MEVLGHEVEVAGAKLLDQPCDLVHARPPARRPPAPAVDDPLRPPLLIGVAQPAAARTRRKCRSPIPRSPPASTHLNCFFRCSSMASMIRPILTSGSMRSLRHT